MDDKSRFSVTSSMHIRVQSFDSLKRFSTSKKNFRKEMFWSRGFCLLTTGGYPIDGVKKYIENQDKK